MRSLKRTYNKLANKNKNWSSYLCFAESIKGRGFAHKVIRHYFNKLVDKSDYAQNEKREILKFLYLITLPNSFQNSSNAKHAEEGKF
jgi:hypothetical protein